MSIEDTDMADLSTSSQAHVVPSEDEFQSESESSTEATSSDESDIESTPDDEWTPEDTRTHLPFTGEFKIHSGSAKTPVDYFKLLFNKTFVNLLVSSINMHMIELITNSSSKFYGNEFRPTDVEEVYTLLAVYFFMGYVRINEWCYYWETDHLYNLKFDKYMNKDRFSLLVRALAYKKKGFGLGTDHGEARRSWYDTAKPLAEYFNRLMKTLASPGKSLNIDKYTAYWFHEYNFVCKKPERIRIHFLSDENGIFHRIYLCHPDSKNHGDEVVKALMSDFLCKGHSLYTCPFYTSITLAEELLEKRTYLTGILKRKKNRNPMFVRKRLKIGAIKSLYSPSGVCLTNFRRNLTILSLSTEHTGKLVEGKVMLPEMTVQYKNNTKSMLKRNQTLSDNAPQDFTKKYNKNVFYLLQVMFMNAFTMHNMNEEKRNFSDFRREILEHCLPIPKNTEDCDSEDDTDTSVESRDDILDSEVIHLPSKVNKSKKTTRNCRHCWLICGMRRPTLFYCPQCPQKWGLCIECFRSFHKY